MILLDTNVLSEIIRSTPEQSVVSWLDNQLATNLYLSAITVAEILYGIARLPKGKRKSTLIDATNAMFLEDFQDRILAFDAAAAKYYADIVVLREQKGRPISMADAQIAAICMNHNATLATRNVRDFEALVIKILNPWTVNSLS